MIKATLIDKATGKAFAHVGASSTAALLTHGSDEIDVVIDKLLPLAPLAPAIDLDLENLRNRRNRELDAAAWTWRADSPLTVKCQKEWLDWAKRMQGLFKTGPVPMEDWPTKPGYSYV